MIVIQNPMDMRRVSFFIVILVLVFSFRIRSSEGRKEAEKLDYYGASPQIDEETVQKLWISCRLHLEGMPEGLDLWPPEEMSIASNSDNSEEYILAKQNLQQAISFLPREINQALLDCLEKHNIACDVSGEEDNSKNWFAGYLKSVLKWYAVPRRYLAAESPGIGAEVPAPAPAPAPGAHPPRSEAPMSLFFPPNFDINSPPPPSNQHKQPSGRAQSSSSPRTAPSVPSKKQNNQRSVVVAVSVTVAVTLVVVSLLFCCYQKCRKRDSGGGLKDESPLLHLSLSDYSVGSSGKSSSLANSVKKEKYENLSYSNPNQSIKHSYSDSNFSVESDTLNYSAADARLSEVTSGNDRPSVGIVSGGIGEIGAPFTHLKPPPGRIVPSPSVSLLPPPPGRPVRPPLGKTVSPPPGQAVPPPPGKAVPSPPGPPPPPAPRGPPPPPPMASSYKPGPRAPPPPKGTPPRPPPSVNTKVPQSSEYGIQEKEAPKTKLKPFFWDKVLANPDHSMVWDQISTGSFQFNEDMIETLFGYNAAEKGKNERKKESLAQDPSMQYIQIIEAKKAQNLSILLRALNVTTEEVHDALKEGNELPPALLETLLKMAPTAEEELKLRLFSGDISQLGPAERFLKVLVGVPFAFKRLDSLLFMGSLQEEFLSIKESLETLEIACTELRNSRLFLKLLEAVLKTGNRMNDGTFRGQATAFKLDTLLKLADVKGTDGKTTLLHFVVQEIIRSEGSRAIRLSRESQSFSSVKSDDLIEDSSPVSVEQFRNRGLQVVSGLSGELENVKKAAVLDADGLTSTVSKLGNALLKNKEFLNKELKDLDEDSGFRRALVNFLEQAEDKITFLLEEEKRIMTIVKKTADYFHGHAGKDEGLRLFVIVRDFLIMLDKACKEVRESAMKQTRPLVNKESAIPRVPLGNDLQERFFPAILERRVDNNSSSDDEDD